MFVSCLACAVKTNILKLSAQTISGKGERTRGEIPRKYTCGRRQCEWWWCWRTVSRSHYPLAYNHWRQFASAAHRRRSRVHLWLSRNCYPRILSVTANQMMTTQALFLDKWSTRSFYHSINLQAQAQSKVNSVIDLKKQHRLILSVLIKTEILWFWKSGRCFTVVYPWCMI